MEEGSLILNIVNSAPDNDNKSLRSQWKGTNGSWKEKNRIRRNLKKASWKTNKTEERNNPIATSTVPDNQSPPVTKERSNNKVQLLPSTEVISSLFTHNPEIPQLPQSSHDSSHLNPSNAPNKDALPFSNMGLDDDLSRHLEEELQIRQPTNIQSKAIPFILTAVNDHNSHVDADVKPADIIIQAETGSGKTLAYLLPIIHCLLRSSRETINLSRQVKLTRSIGTLAIILVPTRELTKQILSVIESLLKKPSFKSGQSHLLHWLVPGTVVGGENKNHEKNRIRKGINILVSTPGRLLDHLQNTKSFALDSLRWLVLDEADRLLELGFEETLEQISKLLKIRSENYNNPQNPFAQAPSWPTFRRTILCSATARDDIRQFAGYTLVDPVYINADDNGSDNIGVEAEAVNSLSDITKYPTPKQLKHKYVITPAKLRLVTLTAILKSTFRTHYHGLSTCRKVIVFISCCDSVDFHFDLFANANAANILTSEDMEDVQTTGTTTIEQHTIDHSKTTINSHDKSVRLVGSVIPNIGLYRLHGDLPQIIRMKTLQQFSEANSGILFCTDVAARGLDLPYIEKIIQYDPPLDLLDYIHRVGRTARLGKNGESIIFLLPSEIGYLNVLSSIKPEALQVESILETLASSKHKEYEAEATNIQLDFERYVLSDPKYAELARMAFLSHLRAYAAYPSSEKHIFHIKKLHMGHMAKGFALRDAPSNIDVSQKSMEHKKRIGQKKGKNSGKRKELDNKTALKTKRKYDSSEFAIPDLSTLSGPTTKKKRKK
ncbi:10516_t:CDS:2 [Paraglomus brasilianum]|uniref:ATP-dependent RNA helicase n=1 Tax=Paraglomus brasilianum TaxID=144538 RepID=A0A9N8VI05_9GLOM|nr:10516_t:CDS:2 [Paraglomus brasilianum]